ncbi:hypothetical protein PMI09_02202 [Rhizobium sp. CF122]|uniref:hypothetical protein n=1 Tax=Rhizobium sp. CF122 TaxID=1144312 RepID=UPI000271D341|nr:hypothetical protein [Rhizobium sp. CF122]EJL54886.1 hypothetical protein PMI09_02202 [Rhizobium sp. CF122]
MSSTTEVDFPRLELKLAKGPQYIAVLGGAGIAACLILIALDAVAPNGPWSSPSGKMTTGAVLFTIGMGVGLKLFSRIDFEKVMLTLDREGIWIARPRGTNITHRSPMSIPWTAISKIQYYEIGRLKESKIIAIDLRDTADVLIDANLLRGNARELYETMRRYRRQFAPAESNVAENGQVYQSASWTGLDDE